MLDAIHGADGLDWAAVDYPFDGLPRFPWKTSRSAISKIATILRMTVKS